MKNKIWLVILMNALWGNASQAQEQMPETPKKSDKTATDKAVTVPVPYDYSAQLTYKGVEIQTLYLTMRDSVRLAIDVYLPGNRKKGERFPTLVHQTRYWRKPQLKFPFSLFSNGLLGTTGEMIQDFVSAGYVIVNVDVRGSGASFGKHPHPWTADEIKDGAEIIDWIIRQDWADGKVGSLGASYSGTTAEFLATNQHPNLKAVALLYSLYDAYEDNAFPGGVHHDWFTHNWGEANDCMDNNELPANYRKYKAVIAGVSLVKTKGGRDLLRQAIACHTENRNVHDGALTVDCRDDVPDDGFISSLDVFSPHAYIDKINQTQVAVYSYSGWMDGAYQNAAIKRYLNLQTPGKKLLIGPWEHGGKFNISPAAPSLAGFSHTAELLKFFDYHLKGIQNGLDKEPPVHYFTMGMEKWRSSDVWPPAGAQLTDFYLHPDKTLKPLIYPLEDMPIRYAVDNTTGSGMQTRWRAVNGKVETAYMYYDWNERAKKLLSYSTDVLTEDTEMTGHPLADLYVSLSTNDGTIFVYIEDVDEQGRAVHVTEGELRVSHRQLTDTPLYREATPSRTHLRRDLLPLQPNEVARLQFDLLPVSYLFKKGHRIRISIAGVDINHFEILNRDGYTIQLHHSKEYPSKVVLPMYR